jgi:hypothetical protein
MLAPSDEAAIPPLPREVKAYIEAFGIAAIVTYPDGRIGVTQNPKGAATAWWCDAKQAGAVVRTARANGCNVLAALHELKVPVTEHCVVLARAQTAARRISVALAQAQDRGDLAFFDAEYKLRRLAAQAAGRGFMSYAQARSRLQKAIAGAAATGGELTRSLIETVLGG